MCQCLVHVAIRSHTVGLAQRAVILAIEEHVLGLGEVCRAEQVAERGDDGISATVDYHVASGLCKLEELLCALVVVVIIFLPAALVESVTANESGCHVAVDVALAIALADVVKGKIEVFIDLVHDLVARCAVFVDLVAVEVGELVLIIRHIAKDVDQASILDAVEQTGEAHPVVVSLIAERAFHTVFQTVAHDVDLADEGEVPCRTLIFALIVARGGRDGTLREGHLTCEVGL